MCLFRFPKDPAKCCSWVQATRRIEPDGKVWQPRASSTLCSRHFTEESFDKTGATVRLRDDAVPSIFDFTVNLRVKELAILNITTIIQFSVICIV